MKAISTKGKKLAGDVIVSVLLLLVFSFNLLWYVEYKLQDLAFQRPASINPDIIVIGIDEEALGEFGKSEQWSRQLYADAVNILNSSEEYKPAVVALDILFVGEREDAEADRALAEAARNGGNVVVAARAVIGDVQSPDNPGKTVRSPVGYEKPYAALAEYADYGAVNAIFDRDGIIRGSTQSYEYEGEGMYSFPYVIYSRYIGGEPGAVEAGSENYITFYGKPGDFKQFSFSDVFREDFDPEFLADCIVFIGPFAAGLMDAYYTPASYEDQMNGVEIHANTVQMLLEDNFKTYAPKGVNFLILAFIIISGFVLAYFLGIKVLLGAFLALAAAYVFLASRMFTGGQILTLAYPLMAFVVIYLYQLVYSYTVEALEKQKVKSAFKKYVDPKLVDKLMESGEAQSDAVGMERDIAVLFVDVRGFTPMTEALKDQPELIVKILNEYLELTSKAVFDNGGSVDKFIGDATMALFNGFVPLDDYVYRAVKAAWDIVQGASEVNASIKEKYDVDVGFGVGVNCGNAIVGNLGPSFRKDYTAIGDTVNTAARLESNAKRAEVLISQYVYDRIKERIEAKSVGEIPLKGKSIKLEVFSVTNIF